MQFDTVFHGINKVLKIGWEEDGVEQGVLIPVPDAHVKSTEDLEQWFMRSAMFLKNKRLKQIERAEMVEV